MAMGMEDLFELEAPVSAPRSSVPFRGRLFAFVLQTGRLLFFTWHRRPRCICHIPLLIFFTPASHWLGCISRGTRAPYRSYDPRRNSAEPPRGTLAKLGRPRPHGPRPLTILPPREEACRQLQLFTCRHRPKRPCLDQSTDLTVGGPVNNYRVVVGKSLSWREWEVGWALMAI